MLLYTHTDYLNNTMLSLFFPLQEACDISTKCLHEFTAGENQQISIDSFLDVV